METPDRTEITGLLLEAREGKPDALDRLYPLMYEALRGLAHRALRREREGHTLGTTALVHEAYLRLVDQNRATWHDRAHFLAIAATIMRRILVDHARRQHRQKRGGDRQPVSLDESVILADQRAEELLALDEALERLSALNPRLGQVVECRFFAGLTTEETAEALQVTSRTVERDWQKARGWLYDQLGEQTV